MNEEFLDFIKRNNIDINALQSYLRIYTPDEINYILSNNRIECAPVQATVSIADIIGYELSRSQSNNIAQNFSCFFSTDSTYQSRSLGMLEYSSDEVMEKLSRSFIVEPMRVLELDNGKKIININGLHRYTVLRLHYLNEFLKVKGDEAKETALRKKYEIPVILDKVDLLKTYCRYLINLTSSERITVSNAYDENYRITGNATVKENKTKATLNDAALIAYTKDRIMRMSKEMKSHFLQVIQEYSDIYASFKDFIDKYFAEEIAILIEETSERGKGSK